MLNLSLLLTAGLQRLAAGLQHSQRGMAQPSRTHIAHGGGIQVLASPLLVPVCRQPADQQAQPRCEPA